MANGARGEATVVVDGELLSMRLTLGGLAELEEALSAGGLVALAERFESGRASARDLIALLGCGLRGAGHDISDEALSAREVGPGAVAAMKAGIALLQRSFGDG